VLALLPAMLAMQGQDFIRQVLYVEKRIRSAFVNDLINYGGLCLGVAALAAAGVLTPTRCLLIMALTSGLAVVVGLVQLRGSVHWRYCRADVLARNRENWRIGRWMLGVAALSVSSNYLTPFVVGAASGAAAAGALRAMVAVMGPVNIVYRTITTALIPAAARAYDSDGLPGLKRLMHRAGAAAALSVGTYAALIAIFAAPLLSLVYGDAYAAVAWMMPLIALAHVLGTASSLLDTAVRAQRITDTPFAVSVTNFVMFWAVGAPLIAAFGLRGAAATLVAVPIIALVLQAARLWREGRRQAVVTTLKEA
jgi:O-antigen/teichoic acid export membrane protein